MKWVSIRKRKVPTYPGPEMNGYEYGFYIYEKPEKMEHFRVSCHECGNSFCAACRYQREKYGTTLLEYGGTTALENKAEQKWVRFTDYIKDKESVSIKLKNAVENNGFGNYTFDIGRERNTGWCIPRGTKIDELGMRFILDGSPAIIELEGCQLRIEGENKL